MGQKKTTIQTGTWSPTWGYSLQASASMAQYPTNQNRSAGTNYWVTVDGKNQLDSTTSLAGKAGWINGVSPKNR